MSSFVRLHFIVEGQTEENFVNKVIGPYLASRNIFCDAISVLTSKDKKAHRIFRGGLLDYERAMKDIVAWMKQDNDKDCRFTTMFDLYALPQDFPGFDNSRDLRDPYRRVVAMEEALGNAIEDWRFIPYLQLHEFEALVLADPERLAVQYLEHDTQIANLSRMVEQEGGNPELIDDGPQTAPSKRILDQIPEYDKANDGPIVTEKIGLQTLRLRCTHFSNWIERLESCLD